MISDYAMSWKCYYGRLIHQQQPFYGNDYSVQPVQQLASLKSGEDAKVINCVTKPSFYTVALYLTIHDLYTGRLIGSHMRSV